MTRNLWHSCGRHRIDDHFVRKDPVIRTLFDRFVALAQRCGPMKVYAQKTRIVFQVRVRFGGVVTYKHWLDCALWLTRRAPHPRLKRVENPVPNCYVHYFRLSKPADIDRALGSLVREAYGIGCQEHLKT